MKTTPSFFRCFFTELKKYKHRYVFLTFFAGIFFELAWIGYNLKDYQDFSSSTDFLGIAIYNFNVLNCLVLPIVYAILAGRIMEIENKENTYRILLMRIDFQKLYYVKVAIMLLFAFLSAFFQTAFIALFAHFVHGTIPVSYWIPAYFFTVFLVGAVNGLLVLFFSIRFENPLYSLIFGLFLGFFGFLSTLFPKIISFFFFWTYYHALSIVDTVYSYDTKQYTFYYHPISVPFLIISFILLLLFYYLGLRAMEQREF